jgi:hypothetical protein
MTACVSDKAQEQAMRRMQLAATLNRWKADKRKEREALLAGDQGLYTGRQFGQRDKGREEKEQWQGA